MNLLKRILTILLLCSASSTSVLAGDQTLDQLGISFHEHPLAANYRLAYLTAGYDYSGAARADRVVPARLFIVAPSSELRTTQDFLKARFRNSARLERLQPLEGDSLLARPELQGATVFEITALFPITVLRQLGRQGATLQGNATCENCLGTARSFHTDEPVGSLDTPEFQAYLEKLQRVDSAAAPQFGEVLHFPKNEHAAIYLFDGLIFQKPTWGVFHQYEIVRYEDMFEAFNRTVGYFTHGAPAGSATPSAWDIFVSGLQGAKPLGAPRPLTDPEFVVRYRPLDCAGLLLGETP